MSLPSIDPPTLVFWIVVLAALALEVWIWRDVFRFRRRRTTPPRHAPPSALGAPLPVFLQNPPQRD
jgi:hypothetical protein